MTIIRLSSVELQEIFLKKGKFISSFRKEIPRDLIRPFGKPQVIEIKPGHAPNSYHTTELHKRANELIDTELSQGLYEHPKSLINAFLRGDKLEKNMYPIQFYYINRL